jgi:hypothetical protein
VPVVMSVTYMTQMVLLLPICVKVAALSKKVTDSSEDIKERAARPAFFEHQTRYFNRDFSNNL